MTKAELALKMSKGNSRTPQECAQFIELFMDTVSSALVEGESIYLRGFGSFEPVISRGRVARSGPGLNEALRLPDSKGVKFYVSGKLNERVNLRWKEGQMPTEA